MLKLILSLSLICCLYTLVLLVSHPKVHQHESGSASVKEIPGNHSMSLIPKANITDIGNILDWILHTDRKPMLIKDHVTLPDQRPNFSRKIFGVRVCEYLVLTEGYLKGMETIRRAGEALQSTDEGWDLILKAHVGLSDLKAGYKMEAKIMGIGLIKARVDGDLTNVEAILQVRVKPSLKISIEILDVTDTGVLNVVVTGLGPLFDFLTRQVINVVGNTVKGWVVDYMEEDIRSVVNKFIEGRGFHF